MHFDSFTSILDFKMGELFEWINWHWLERRRWKNRRHIRTLWRARAKSRSPWTIYTTKHKYIIFTTIRSFHQSNSENPTRTSWNDKNRAKSTRITRGQLFRNVPHKNLWFMIVKTLVVPLKEIVNSSSTSRAAHCTTAHHFTHCMRATFGSCLQAVIFIHIIYQKWNEFHFVVINQSHWV